MSKKARLVRPASELVDVTMLQVSQQGVYYLRYNWVGGDLPGLVWRGRKTAYVLDEMMRTGRMPQGYQRPTKLRLELAAALDSLGFIRHDIDPRTFGLGHVLRLVYGEQGTYPERFRELDNDTYERFRNAPDGEYERALAELKRILQPTEYQVYSLRSGFDETGNVLPLQPARVSEVMGLTEQETRQIWQRAVRQIAWYRYQKASH